MNSRTVGCMHDRLTSKRTRLAIIKFSCVMSVTVLTACTPEPPPYESHATSPSPSVTSQPTNSAAAQPDSLSAEASFVDDFNRQDTPIGLGEGWNMRTAQSGEAALRPATDGYIKDRHFTYAGKSDVIAIRQFRAPILSIGAEGQFVRRSSSTAETIMMFGTAEDSNLQTNMVVFTSSRTAWGVHLRNQVANSKLKEIANGQFARPLELGRNYTFLLRITGSQVRITGPGLDVSRSLPTPLPVNAFGFWREYPDRPSAGGIFDFGKVWALEDGLPAQPVATSISTTGN
ncbi:hypothetical protein MAUB1S_02032 [Mycolicibacterium aubagnense]